MDPLLVGLLLLLLLVGLAMIALGLPGLWLMLLGALGYAALTDFGQVGATTLVVVTLLAVIGEVIEWWVGFRYAERYGGSRRAGWGALLGGIIGAFAGVPVPVLGSILGSFLGSFIGAALFEATHRPDAAARAGWGALLGRLWATALKTSLGLVIAVVVLWAAWT